MSNDQKSAQAFELDTRLQSHGYNKYNDEADMHRMGKRQQFQVRQSLLRRHVVWGIKSANIRVLRNDPAQFSIPINCSLLHSRYERLVLYSKVNQEPHAAGIGEHRLRLIFLQHNHIWPEQCRIRWPHYHVPRELVRSVLRCPLLS